MHMIVKHLQKSAPIVLKIAPYRRLEFGGVPPFSYLCIVKREQAAAR